MEEMWAVEKLSPLTPVPSPPREAMGATDVFGATDELK